MKEEIPNDAQVCRLVDRPRMLDIYNNLIYENIFAFPSNEDPEQNERESLVWTKYAIPPEEVHCIGCEREMAKRRVRADMRYGGYIAAAVGAIRGKSTARGHGYFVEHVPIEAKLYHAEVGLKPAGGEKLKKTDKDELRFVLREIFSPLVGHTCAA